jgi:hypothetical protein
MTETTSITSTIDAVLRSILKVLSLPFAALIRRLRARRDLYYDFWNWADEASEEIKLRDYTRRGYVVLALFKTAIDLQTKYDELRDLQKRHIRNLPLGLRRKLNALLERLKPIVLQYAGAENDMYSSAIPPLGESEAQEAKEKLGNSLEDIRYYCRRRLGKIFYRSLG